MTEPADVTPEIPERIWINPTSLMDDLHREHARVFLGRQFKNDVEYVRAGLASVAQPPEQIQQAAAAIKQLYWDKDIDEANYQVEAVLSKHFPAASLQPPSPQSELPTCLKCGHPDDTDKNGICQTQIGALNWAYCHCKCMFPPPPTIKQIAKQIARDFLAIQANFAAIDHEATLTNYIAGALQLRRERALRDAANDVCMYCDGRAVGYEPAVGPNAAGNYTHEATNKRLLVTSGAKGVVLCAATAIHTRIKHEAAIRAAKQQ